MDGIELTSQADILVMFANSYDMQDDRGRSMSGCSVHYYFWGENGEPIMNNHVEFNENKPVGVQRSKVSMDYELRHKLVVAPGIYRGTFRTVTGGDGKPVLKLIDVAFKSFVKLEAYDNPGFYCDGMLNPPEWKQSLSQPGMQMPASAEGSAGSEPEKDPGKAGKVK